MSDVQKASALKTERATMLMVAELRLRRILLAALGASELKDRQIKQSFWRRKISLHTYILTKILIYVLANI